MILSFREIMDLKKHHSQTRNFKDTSSKNKKSLVFDQINILKNKYEKYLLQKK